MYAEQDELTYRLSKDEKIAYLVKVESSNKEIVIPRSIKYEMHEYIVSSIRENSFIYEYPVKTIKFDQNSEIKKIETNVINHIVQSLDIPASVCELQEGWCKDASVLKKVNIMPNNKYFKKYEDKLIIGKSNIQNEEYDILVFAERDVQAVTIPSYIKRIASSAFAYTEIKCIFIPSNVEEIGERAFEHCSKLVKFDIAPDSKLKKIGCNLLSHSCVESFSIPPKVTEINEVLSLYSKKLIPITIMPGNKHFKSYDNKLILGKSDMENEEFDVIIIAFRNIKSVLIPPNIKKIASYAFSESKIESVTIPPNVIHICEGAFKNCKSLKSIEIAPNSKLQIIEKESFNNTSIEYIFVPQNVKEICERTFGSCKKLKVVEIPPDSKLQTINTFSFCNTLIDRIFLPASVFQLKESWCNCTTLLNKITVDSKNKKYKSYDDTFIAEKINENSEEYDTLIFVIHNIKSVSIPPNIKRIAPKAFLGCQAENVFISKNVTVVCYNAFYCCDYLRKIEFEKGSNLLTIEDNAFTGSSIETLIIPSNIQKYWFYNWLNGSHILGGIIVYPNNEQNIMLYDNKFIIGKSDIKSNEYDILLFVPRNIKSITIPSFIKIIGPSAFQNSLINNILIPKNVIKISNSSFKNCNYLQNVDFQHDSKIEEIGSHTFHGSAIERFCMPSTVTKCGYNAFIICDNIIIIELSENLKNFPLQKITCFKNDVLIMVPTNLSRNCFI